MKIFKKEGKFFMQDGAICVEVVPNKDYWLKLPENSVDRVWVSCNKVDKAPNQCVDYGDVVKTHRTPGSMTYGNKKPLEDYLSEEDKKLYLELIEKAKKAREEAQKIALSPLEKAKREFEKWQRKIIELGGNA